MTQEENKKNQEKSSTDSARLKVILDCLSLEQIRFITARQECATDKEAAEAIGIKPDTVYQWKHKGIPIEEACQLMAYDGLITALHIRKRNLVKAMMVKVAGLDLDDDSLRQRVATEIIEWETGKANQPIEHKGELTVKGYSIVSPDDWSGDDQEN